MSDGSPLIVEYFKISNIDVSEEVSIKQTQGYKEWYEKKELIESMSKKSRHCFTKCVSLKIPRV
jgi:hypothetical protein